jgi:hypothetical protein
MTYSYHFEFITADGDNYTSDDFDNLQDARAEIAELKKEGAIITRKFRYINDELKGSF